MPVARRAESTETTHRAQDQMMTGGHHASPPRHHIGDTQPARVGRILAVPAELAPTQCLWAGRTDLTGGVRPSDCT